MRHFERAIRAGPPLRPVRGAASADLASFIRSDDFPCVGAKAALSQDNITTFDAGDILAPTADEALHRALTAFGAAVRAERNAVLSLACVFAPRPLMSEEAFERALWARLQALHDIDVRRGLSWAGGVSRDPKSTAFSMSVARTAYYVVGLHPGASRPARRFPRPAMIFNAHEQFERLREDGRYYQMQKIIREREMAQVGSINPMLSDHRKGREAAQYSGRVVGEKWECPFKPRT